MIYHVNDQKEFNELVNREGVNVVDFFATWCGPCRMLAPVIEEIDKEGLLKCDFIKVDVDEVDDVAMQFGISSIPTLIIFKDGKPVSKMVGFRGKNDLIKAIQEVQ